MDNPTLELAQTLISRPSVTPDDAGCCQIIADHLTPLGFEIEYFNEQGVTNLWARRGEQTPLIVLAGHTDVVPSGPLEEWTSDPFTPQIRDGMLYGRGAADMKSAIAAMICAVQRIIGKQAALPASLAFLITSDEEGPARHGTRYAIERLQSRGVVPDYAVVGEASSNQRLGDRIVVGRRGSLGANLTVFGKQGHVAYPHKADNPLHRMMAALSQLSATRWDEGNEHFPPTSFQVSNVNGGTGASNVIPGECSAVFNFRFSTQSSAEQLKAQVENVLSAHCPSYQCDWWLSGEPFLTRPGKLIESAQQVIESQTGIRPETFTGGGTSDARFIAPWGAEVAEIGPINESIHKINEHVRVDDLTPLSEIYEQLILRLMASYPSA